jgi:hypothetical protein
MRKTLAQSLLLYSVAAVIVLIVARGVAWQQVIEAIRRANLRILLGASLGGFACWFVGETLLYSRLFSYFHRPPTGNFELLQTTAAVYFLQIVNSLVASSALALFLHTRKGNSAQVVMQRLFDIVMRLGRGKAAAHWIFGRSGAVRSTGSCRIRLTARTSPQPGATDAALGRD